MEFSWLLRLLPLLQFPQYVFVDVDDQHHFRRLTSSSRPSVFFRQLRRTDGKCDDTSSGIPNCIAMGEGKAAGKVTEIASRLELAFRHSVLLR